MNGNEVTFRFVCINIDSVGGNIDMDAHLKQEPTIASYNLIIILSIISIISITAIKKKFLKIR